MLVRKYEFARLSRIYRTVPPGTTRGNCSIYAICDYEVIKVKTKNELIEKLQAFLKLKSE